MKPAQAERPEVKEDKKVSDRNDFAAPTVTAPQRDDSQVNPLSSVFQPQPVQNIPAAPRPASPNAFGGGFNSGFGNAGGMGGSMGAATYGGAGFGGGLGTSTSFMQSRDDRKKVIEETYKKVLGRDPNQNDLNYFLNIGITEDQLTKRMIDSQEHADLVKSRQDIIEIKKKFEESSVRLNELETRTRDQEGIIKSLNSLLAEKNQALSEMNLIKREEERKKIKKEREEGSNPVSAPQAAASNDPYHNYKPSLSDRIFKFFSDIFE